MRITIRIRFHSCGRAGNARVLARWPHAVIRTSADSHPRMRLRFSSAPAVASRRLLGMAGPHGRGKMTQRADERRLVCILCNASTARAGRICQLFNPRCNFRVFLSDIINSKSLVFHPHGRWTTIVVIKPLRNEVEARFIIFYGLYYV